MRYEARYVTATEFGAAYLAHFSILYLLAYCTDSDLGRAHQ